MLTGLTNKEFINLAKCIQRESFSIRDILGDPFFGRDTKKVNAVVDYMRALAYYVTDEGGTYHFHRDESAPSEKTDGQLLLEDIVLLADRITYPAIRQSFVNVYNNCWRNYSYA
jgi:hypothetical protein